MEHRVEEATAMQERESAKRAVEEALAQEREKISILTNEVEEMKVLLHMLNLCIIRSSGQYNI
jgi:myosin-5